MDDLTNEFLAESQEGLDRIERCLTDLERRPGDTELVDEIFRAVHTIKGGTGFLGFGRLEALAHTGESLLGSLRAGRLQVTAELIDALLALRDGLRAILQLIEITGSEGQRSTDDDFDLIARLMALHAADGKCSGPGVEFAPDWGLAEGERRGRLQQSEINSGVRTAEQPGASERASALLSNIDAAEGRLVRGGGEKTLRVDVDVLNRMMNLVGELVLTRNRIVQSGPAADDFSELGRRLDAVTSDLRETVMRARMQPVGHLFAKFPRMVRDLARACGRRVRIEFHGEKTGLDKGLLEAVRDPLTHAIRNAVDHGIEPPELRAAAGKAAEGVIGLSAYHQNGWVVIELADDGSGISVDRVLRKAVERGLVTPEQAARMTNREALRLIFAAGFSLAGEVTSVSGRGVGMDVIRENVERVGGTVELESHVGLGTTVRMRVPLTLAIVPALMVRSGGQSFALPQGGLLELVYVLEAEVASAIQRIGNAELYRLRERLVPLVRLNRLLGLEKPSAVSRAPITIAFVEANGCRYGLIVEELLAPEEIVVKPLSSALRRIGLFAGATVLGNGTLALILDVAGIGAKAGVSTEVRSALGEFPRTTDCGSEQSGPRQSLVVYEVVRMTAQGPRLEKVAVPLDAVERIETIEREQIEFVGGHPLLRCGQELAVLQDDGGVLGRLECGRLTVLICRGSEQNAGQPVAVVVERVLDVCAGASSSSMRGPAGERLALVNDTLVLLNPGFHVELPQDALVEAV